MRYEEQFLRSLPETDRQLMKQSMLEALRLRGSITFFMDDGQELTASTPSQVDHILLSQFGWETEESASREVSEEFKKMAHDHGGPH